MPTRRYREISSGDPTEINLSPLIDMVFILLIFFIVTSVFAEREGIEIERPAASASSSLETDILLLQIDPSGQILHRGEALSTTAVARLVRRFVADGGTSVVIEADADGRTRDLVAAVDLATAAGAPSVSVATRPENRP